MTTRTSVNPPSSLKILKTPKTTSRTSVTNSPLRNSNSKSLKKFKLIIRSKDPQQVYAELQQQMLAQVEQTNALYVDKDFPADKKSLFKNPHKVPDFARDIKQIKWYRPKDIVKDAKFLLDYQCDVKQGAFGDSWFIGAVVQIAGNEDLIKQLIVDHDHFDQGFVTF